MRQQRRGATHLHLVELALHDGQLGLSLGLLAVCNAELGLGGTQRHDLRVHHLGHLLVPGGRQGRKAWARQSAATAKTSENQALTCT